jgi:hypothetical protein
MRQSLFLNCHRLLSKTGKLLHKQYNHNIMLLLLVSKRWWVRGHQTEFHSQRTQGRGKGLGTSVPILGSLCLMIMITCQGRIYSKQCHAMSCYVFPTLVAAQERVWIKSHYLDDHAHSNWQERVYPRTLCCPIILIKDRKECILTLFPAWKREARSECTPTLNLSYACLRFSGRKECRGTLFPTN